MATFTKRPAGWHARVRKSGVDVSESGFRTKADANAWAMSVEADILAGRLGRLPDKTYGDLLQRYAKNVSSLKRGARWEHLRIALFLREFPELCQVKLDQLGAAHFSAWRDKRLTQVSALSVRREMAIHQHVCSVAVKEWQWLLTHPLMAVKKPEQPPARSRRPTDDETVRILLACGYDRDIAPLTQQARVGAAWLFAIETGMRAAEICGLTRETVDLTRRVAHLAQTKNGHSRDVPLSREAMRLVGQVMEAVPDGAVFGLLPSLLDRLFRKAKERALIEDLHFHDSRREALTRMAAKVDVLTLAKISGHRDLRILQNTYYAPDMADVVARLD